MQVHTCNWLEMQLGVNRFAVCGLRFAVCGLRFAVGGWPLAVGLIEAIASGSCTDGAKWENGERSTANRELQTPMCYKVSSL
jgi:hypothetical protein